MNGMELLSQFNIRIWTARGIELESIEVIRQGLKITGNSEAYLIPWDKLDIARQFVQQYFEQLDKVIEDRKETGPDDLGLTRGEGSTGDT